MIYFSLLGGLFLGWSFGRNNLSTVFGTAVGTRMVPFRLAALLAGIFIFLGALLSSTETTSSILQISDVHSLEGAFLISASVGLTIFLTNRCGIPVSIVQSFVGTLVGWNLFFHIPNNWKLLSQMAAAWFYAPLIAAACASVCFYAAHALFNHIKIPLLYRDCWVRILLICTGIYASYFMGANNMPALAGAYLSADKLTPWVIILAIGVSIAVGALMADKKVISTVSSGLFLLSPVEALVVVLSCGLTLYCFSGSGLQGFLQACNLPSFPLVPIPTTNVLIGSIIGVGCAKKCSAIQWHALSKILISWIIVPVISGLICWLVLAILIKGGQVL